MVTEEARRRPGGRSARIAQAVADATLTVMAEKGLADFTVTDVAMRAGVHETSIYRRWGSRENLIAETLLAYSERLIPVPDTGSIRTDLRELLAAVADYLSTPIGKAMSHALAFSGDETRWEKVRFDFWTTRLQLARSIVDRAIERQEVPPNTDARLLLETLIAPLQFRTLATREPFDRDLCDRLTDLVLDGILPRSTNTRKQKP
ncbi:TetR/AcrR family transcriptional regulator [Mycobacterium yunnanensis]|uniref:TetR/AcrR family transcriptional regulator n=1 Tax=Mycobacterium yunnanensis TaxID=368477 RepID=A0A9X2YY61_9MYCO|nr:TetR/AcrR family transcriptional regulator [Mycobacterium yunnanensis]